MVIVLNLVKTRLREIKISKKVHPFYLKPPKTGFRRKGRFARHFSPLSTSWMCKDTWIMVQHGTVMTIIIDMHGYTHPPLLAVFGQRRSSAMSSGQKFSIVADISRKKKGHFTVHVRIHYTVIPFVKNWNIWRIPIVHKNTWYLS